MKESRKNAVRLAGTSSENSMAMIYICITLSSRHYEEINTTLNTQVYH